MTPAGGAFAASALLAVAGTCVALGGLASLQSDCSQQGQLGVGRVTSNCNTVLSFFWVVWALQAFFLLSTAAAAAAAAVHTFRSSMWAQGAVAAALAVFQCSRAYKEIKAPQQGAHTASWDAYLAGTCIYIGANVLMAFAGDAMYRTLRIERRDGFVTFKRVPSKWLAKAAAAAPEDEAAAAAEPAHGAALRAAFLASALVSVAGTCVALGGVAALQSSCSTEGFTISRDLKLSPPGTSCDTFLSFFWIVWALQVAALVATAVCYAQKQIHCFRHSLWSLAAAATALAAHVTYVMFRLTSAEPQARCARDPLRPRYSALLAGSAIYVSGNLLLIVIGDAVYRLKHVEGADGFVSMRRPGPAAEPGAGAQKASQQKRPVDYAFLAAAALTTVGMGVALGGLAATQSTCQSGKGSFGSQGKVWVLADCNSWLSFPWLAWALQCVVLAGTLAAWATDSVHSFESSLWGMAAVVLYAGVYSLYTFRLNWDTSTGSFYDSLVVAVVGFSILVSGNYLMMFCGDALHHLRRVEGRDGFVTFYRPDRAAPTAAAAGLGVGDKDAV